MSEDRKEQKYIREIMAKAENPCAVDLGACYAEDSWRMMMAAVHAGKRPRIVIVEPDPRNLKIIREEGILNEPNADVDLIPAAIAAHTGHCEFYVCYNDTEQAFASGSIRKPTGHLEQFPWCTFPEVIKDMRCYTLDSVFLNLGLDHIDVLWVDIQGAERDMIAGGQRALYRTHYLYMEAEEKELYEGQALRDDLLGMLPGWQVVETFEWNVLLKNRNYE